MDVDAGQGMLLLGNLPYLIPDTREQSSTVEQSLDSDCRPSHVSSYIHVQSASSTRFRYYNSTSRSLMLVGRTCLSVSSCIYNPRKRFL